MIICQRCGGTGFFEPAENFTYGIDCPACKGSGQEAEMQRADEPEPPFDTLIVFPVGFGSAFNVRCNGAAVDEWLSIMRALVPALPDGLQSRAEKIAAEVPDLYMPYAVVAVDEIESPTPVTDSEHLAGKAVTDILTGKISKPDLPGIRQAIDKVEAPKQGRDKADHALGHISGNRK